MPARPGARPAHPARHRGWRHQHLRGAVAVQRGEPWPRLPAAAGCQPACLPMGQSVLPTGCCLCPWASEPPPPPARLPACLPAHQHNPLAPGPLLLSLLPQDTSRNDPRKRLRRFFESLYACLAKGARAVLQVYPANTDQAAMMTNAAMRAGFGGGLVVDFPHRCLLLSACCLLLAAFCLLLAACSLCVALPCLHRCCSQRGGCAAR